MLHPDSISHSSHNVAVGRATSRACNLDQSIPSTSAASCEALSRISPPITGGHLKFPFSSRFQNNTSPDPSQAKIFKRSARLQRKTKIVPENGSCPSCSRTSAPTPSAPLRKSTGLVAIRTRIPAATVIIPPPSRRKARPSASPDQFHAPHGPRHRRSRFLSSRRGQPRRPPTRPWPAQPGQTSARHRWAEPIVRYVPPCAKQTDAGDSSRAAAPLRSQSPQARPIPPRSGPSPRHANGGAGPPLREYQHGCADRKRQLYGQPYMRALLHIGSHLPVQPARCKVPTED